jgi:hypothetical protein
LQNVSTNYMTTKLEEDEYLKIHLLSFDKPSVLTERFYFLEMSTLQATTLMKQDCEIVSAEIEAYTDKNKYLSESDIASFKTVKGFNSFFLSHPDFYIHNCDLKLRDGFSLNSHDDGEVSIEFVSNDSEIPEIIEKIFDKYSLDKKLMSILKSKPGHCISIDEKSQITADFKDFDDYVANGRN